MDITADYLREILDYDPLSGLFRWKPRSGAGSEKWNSSHAGAVVGSKNGKGYIYIRIGARFYRAHRLAWVYVHGKEPDGQIDHIDRCRHNNRLDNLRDVSPSQNNLNSTIKIGRSGERGVTRYESRSGPYYTARFKNAYLGTFRSKEEAAAAYAEASRGFL